MIQILFIFLLAYMIADNFLNCCLLDKIFKLVYSAVPSCVFCCGYSKQIRSNITRFLLIFQTSSLLSLVVYYQLEVNYVQISQTMLMIVQRRHLTFVVFFRIRNAPSTVDSCLKLGLIVNINIYARRYKALITNQNFAIDTLTT